MLVCISMLRDSNVVVAVKVYQVVAGPATFWIPRSSQIWHESDTATGMWLARCVLIRFSISYLLSHMHLKWNRLEPKSAPAPQSSHPQFVAEKKFGEPVVQTQKRGHLQDHMHTPTLS